ncbi:MAG TPA: YbaN family protein [Dokdonella sp.]|uniref:YbaN family protein n=1 Tax=Dokdonella sp. TaxID=2291710 RepID=UPI002D7E5974|nr:YbaN family protein [Dokdonella sp.]HET9031985.1 YbaN family protein [Dokdonella sp.]
MIEKTTVQTSRRWRWAWWLLAYISLGLGIIGIVLPVLPTVPFILLAAYAASRGSQRLHDWLVTHPRMGPMIRDWHETGAVSRNAKWLATTMMIATSVILFLFSPRLWLAIGVSVMMALVATWLWLRPEPPP